MQTQTWGRILSQKRQCHWLCRFPWDVWEIPRWLAGNAAMNPPTIQWGKHRTAENHKKGICTDYTAWDVYIWTSHKSLSHVKITGQHCIFHLSIFVTFHILTFLLHTPATLVQGIPPAQPADVVGMPPGGSCASRGSAHANSLCEKAQYNHSSCAFKFNSSLQQMIILCAGASLFLIPANALNPFLAAGIWRS